MFQKIIMDHFVYYMLTFFLLVATAHFHAISF